MKGNCYVFDIDGTLADCEHRVHLAHGAMKDYREFFRRCVDDTPIEHVVCLALQLDEGPDEIIFVSGRSDEVREQTVRWLEEHGFWVGNKHLYMRKAGDHRPDNVVKLELLAQLRADGYEPIMVFDDRNSVVEMWRAAGIPCAQVAPGDF